jgi:hypothetical protein
LDPCEWVRAINVTSMPDQWIGDEIEVVSTDGPTCIVTADTKFADGDMACLSENIVHTRMVLAIWLRSWVLKVN